MLKPEISPEFTHLSGWVHSCELVGKPYWKSAPTGLYAYWTDYDIGVNIDLKDGLVAEVWTFDEKPLSFRVPVELLRFLQSLGGTLEFPSEMLEQQDSESKEIQSLLDKSYEEHRKIRTRVRE